jgi:hypothetical protein
MLKDEKFISSSGAKALATHIDEDKSLTIHQHEFFTFMIKNLQIKKEGEVLTHLTIEKEI